LSLGWDKRNHIYDRIGIPAQAKVRRWRVEQPPVSNREYPKQLERSLVIRGGLEVLIRPAREGDEKLAIGFLRRVTRDDLRLRFLTAVRAWDPAFIRGLARVDYDRNMLFVAIGVASGTMIGAVRLHLDSSRERGEFAVLVQSDLKGRGLGSELMKTIIDWARAKKVLSIEGRVLRENITMIAMCRELGFEVASDSEDSTVVQVRLGLGIHRLGCAKTH
jgi:acetyltransferase